MFKIRFVKSVGVAQIGAAISRHQSGSERRERGDWSGEREERESARRDQSHQSQGLETTHQPLSSSL